MEFTWAQPDLLERSVSNGAYILRLFGVLAFYSVLPLAFSQAADPSNFAPITPDRILQHIRTLASDDLEGRGPGSDGETKTIEVFSTVYRKRHNLRIADHGCAGPPYSVAERRRL
jgi:hypothetical protein